MLDLIDEGAQMRHVASTRANKESNRSHTLFILKVNQKFPNDSEKNGILNLVDLAGSEKVGKTGATGETLEEAKKINLSLSTIGNVIHAMVLHSSHVPYRESKLTRILQESLGGNFKTSLIVTCSNYSTHTEETISTLRFAQRARSIKNQVKINVKNSPTQMQFMIDQLKSELGKSLQENISLKQQLTENPGEKRNSITSITTPKYAKSSMNIIEEEEESTVIPNIEDNITLAGKIEENKLKPRIIRGEVKSNIERLTMHEIASFDRSSVTDTNEQVNVTLFTQEESDIYGKTSERGLLHNSPRNMRIRPRCKNIYIYIVFGGSGITSRCTPKPQNLEKKSKEKKKIHNKTYDEITQTHNKDTDYINQLKVQLEDRNEDVQALEGKLRKQNERNEGLMESLGKAKEEIKEYRQKVKNLQKKLGEILENSSRKNIRENLENLKDNEFQHRIKTLETTVQKLRESLAENENELKILYENKKKKLESDIIEKVRDVTFFHIKMEDYIKNQRVEFDVN